MSEYQYSELFWAVSYRAGRSAGDSSGKRKSGPERVDDLERIDLGVAIEVFRVKPVNAFSQAGGNNQGVPKGKLILAGQLARPIEKVPVGQETRPHSAERFDFLPYLRLGKAERPSLRPAARNSQATCQSRTPSLREPSNERAIACFRLSRGSWA